MRWGERRGLGNLGRVFATVGKFFIGITLPELAPLVLTGMVEGQ